MVLVLYGRNKVFGQAVMVKCCAGVRAVCHEISVQSVGECVCRSLGQGSTREPADAHLQVASLLAGGDIYVIVYLTYLTIYPFAAHDVINAHPTVPSYIRLDDETHQRKKQRLRDSCPGYFS
jgi:hypothetical protein